MSSSYKVPYLPKHKYHDELIATAKLIATPGKGILAADESTGTIGVRLQEIKADNSRTNRRTYRQLLFTAPNLAQYISGCILFEETLFDKTDDGKDLVQPLRDAGIVLGIKVDLGTKHLPGTDDETYTQGLTDLDKRCASYYKAGCRFAKWRAVLRISESTPSPLAIKENADTLAKYAAICQAHGLVPIVEPEILMDGEHSLAVCQYWTEHVVSTCYRSLNEQHVLLEGTLLKPNMCLPGKQSKGKVSVEDCARATVQALQRTVPPAVPAVVVSSRRTRSTQQHSHSPTAASLRSPSHSPALTAEILTETEAQPSPHLTSNLLSIPHPLPHYPAVSAPPPSSSSSSPAASPRRRPPLP